MKVIIMDSKNNKIKIHMDESETVSHLKEHIKKKLNINGDIELLYNDFLLEDNDILCTYGISEGSIIKYLEIFNEEKALRYFS